MAKIGLVTVLYNSNDVLEDFFKSLSYQTFTDYHLYMIDNSPSAETDAVIDTLSQKYLSKGLFTHIKNSENAGVATGNNQGIKLSLAAGSEYVLLLNNDIYFSQPDLLKDMVEGAQNKNEHLVVPKILYYGTRTIWMAGGDILTYKGYANHYGEDQPDSEKYSKEAHFNYAPTCFMLISKAVFNDIGFMDERYFVYYDDTDFIIRALKKGYKVFVMPALEVFHKVSQSTGGGGSYFSIYYQNRNRIYFIKKNYNIGVQAIAITYTLITRAIRYMQFDKTQKKAILKGTLDGFKMKIN